MGREQVLAFLIREIIRRKQDNKPLRVGIDGRCAAGKSSLAIALTEALGSRKRDVLHVSVDGFHHSRAHRYQQGEDSARGYYEDAYDYQAVIDHVLGPLSKNVFPALCRPVARNLHSDMPDAAAPIAVGPDAVLLFDGIFLFRRELNAYWDFRILLDIDAAASISRAVDRDTGVIGPGDAARRRYEVRYEPAWQIYAREEHPELKADAIVDNRDFEHSRILKPAMGCWG